MVGKLVWDIARKADNLRVKWIHDRYIMDHDWNLYVTPLSASWVVKFICRAKQVILSTCGLEWFAKPSYSIVETYHNIRNSGDKNLSKHSFIGWLMVRQKLQTRSKLAGLGICENNLCLICESEEEDHSHLFF